METKSNRAVAMAKVHAARRAFAVSPECCCGCGRALKHAKNPDKQKLFVQGHDATLKAMLRAVLRGEVRREDIPQAARTNLARLKFIQTNPELRKAFANPSQRERRAAAAVQQ